MKKLLFVVLSMFMLTGCSNSKMPENSENYQNSEVKAETTVTTSTIISTTAETVTETTTEEKTEIPTKPEEISLPENALSIEQAGELLLNKLHNYGYNAEPNQHLSYDSTKTFKYRPCYVFFSYDDFDEHRTTTGWYAVNPVTGECSDITTEQIPLFYRFEITEYGIEVYEKYVDEPFQILYIDADFTPVPEWLYEKYKENGNNDPYSYICMNDFDFDGYDDISVMVYLGATNAVFQYYHYDAETRQFENWTELNKLHFGVQADIRNQTLSSHSKSSAVDAEDIVYKWSGDVLSPVSMEKRYQNGADILVDYFQYDDKGNETLVKREKLTFDEN